MTRRSRARVLTLALGAAGSAAAQAPGPAMSLADVTRLECRFAAVATGTWSEDGSVPGIAVTPNELEAVFTSIDTRAGTAEAVGRFGASYIVARASGGYLHLIQMIDIGPVYVTTVIGQETRDARLMAVHTRHEFAPSSYPEFREHPEMYIGDCAATRG